MASVLAQEQVHGDGDETARITAGHLGLKQATTFCLTRHETAQLLILAGLQYEIV
jgi:hypothetical protein